MMGSFPDDLPAMPFAPAYCTPVMARAASRHLARYLGGRVFKKGAITLSVTLEELLDEGLCFSRSESLRRAHDSISYLQRFSPRKKRGKQSARNLERVRQLIDAGRMTPAGLEAL